MMADPFVKPASYYKRDYDLNETYLHDASTYLSIMEGIDYGTARKFTEEVTSPNGRHPIVAPMARFLHRNSVGDRERKQLPLDKFWGMIREKNQIFSPSQTAYLHPDVEKSILAIYIEGNLAKRTHAKEAQFAAERAGDEEREKIFNSAQTSFKYKNNSLSGAHSSEFTILWNKSSHSTLTSGCRVATSYGNANNEKFLYGNRHYWSPAITKNNIISIVTHSDYHLIESAMRQFNLRAPTVAEVMSMIHRSTNYYWRDESLMQKIHQLVSNLTDLQRAAVMFTGDLYHLSLVNPEFVKTFIWKLATRTEEPASPEDVATYAKSFDEDTITYVSMLCPDILYDKSAQKYKTYKEVADPVAKGILVANGLRVRNVLNEYKDVINAFWTTDNLPSSINYLPNIVRRGVITSDTDSTIFSVARWPIWMTGSDKITTESMAVSSTMIFLTSKVIIHILARFSGNCGVAEQDIFRLAMKNEFFMPVFMLTTRAKHYCALVTMQEGNMKLSPGFDVKGVALRSSNVPPEITDAAHRLMKKLLNAAWNGETVSLRSVLKRVAMIEDEIKRSVLGGSFKYLKSMEIKRREAYTSENGGNYIHYEFWQEVFAPKYGEAPEPPYRSVRFSLDLKNKTQTNAWIDSIEDKAVAQNIRNYLASKGKVVVTTLLLPEANLQTTGIPVELMPIINLRNLIAQTMESFYLVLESLGYFYRDKNNSRLLSDHQYLLDENNGIEAIEL